MLSPSGESNFHVVGSEYPATVILLTSFGMIERRSRDLPGDRGQNSTVMLSFVLVKQIASPSRQFAASRGRVG